MVVAKEMAGFAELASSVWVLRGPFRPASLKRLRQGPQAKGGRCPRGPLRSHDTLAPGPRARHPHAGIRHSGYPPPPPPPGRRSRGAQRLPGKAGVSHTHERGKVPSWAPRETAGLGGLRGGRCPQTLRVLGGPARTGACGAVSGQWAVGTGRWALGRFSFPRGLFCARRGGVRAGRALPHGRPPSTPPAQPGCWGTQSPAGPRYYAHGPERTRTPRGRATPARPPSPPTCRPPRGTG